MQFITLVGVLSAPPPPPPEGEQDARKSYNFLSVQPDHSLIQSSLLCSSQALAGNGTHPRASKKLQWRGSLPGLGRVKGINEG